MLYLVDLRNILLKEKSPKYKAIILEGFCQIILTQNAV